MRGRILIADPDVSRAHCYCRFLAAQDYDVACATGAVDCLLQLRRSVPDVLLLSASLPWGGADGLLDVLRENGRDLPPVVLLVEGTVAKVRHLMRLPVMAVLPVPSDPERLRARLDCLLGERPAPICRSVPSSN